MEQSSLLIKVLAAAKVACEKAGKVVRNVYSKGQLNIIDKGVDDPQTECDRQSQECIIAHLSALFPKITMVAEETLSVVNERAAPSSEHESAFDEQILSISCPKQYEHVNDDDITIWVDPVDGTSSLAKGNLHFVTILIGISVGDEVAAGVVHCPFANDTDDLIFSDEYAWQWSCSSPGHTIYALDGYGIKGLRVRAAPHNHTLTSSKSHWKNIDNGAALALIKACEPRTILHLSGCGFKVLSTLTGVSDFYLYPSAGLKKWDTCAPAALLKVLSGKLTDCAGNALDYKAPKRFSGEAEKMAFSGIENGILASLDSHDLYMSKILKVVVPSATTPNK